MDHLGLDPDCFHTDQVCGWPWYIHVLVSIFNVHRGYHGLVGVVALSNVNIQDVGKPLGPEENFTFLARACEGFCLCSTVSTDIRDVVARSARVTPRGNGK